MSANCHVLTATSANGAETAMRLWTLHPRYVDLQGLGVNLRNLLISGVLLLFSAEAVHSQPKHTQPPLGAALVQQCNFQDKLRGEEGLIVVPENRENDASRVITVHYFRFPAREPSRL